MTNNEAVIYGTDFQPRVEACSDHDRNNCPLGANIHDALDTLISPKIELPQEDKMLAVRTLNGGEVVFILNISGDKPTSDQRERLNAIVRGLGPDKSIAEIQHALNAATEKHRDFIRSAQYNQPQKA